MYNTFLVINQMKSACGILKLSVSFISVRILFMIRHQIWKVRARIIMFLESKVDGWIWSNTLKNINFFEQSNNKQEPIDCEWNI